MSESGACTERKSDDLDAMISEGFQVMREIIGESWERYKDDPEFQFAVDHTHDHFCASDLAVYIVGSSKATLRMIREAQDQAYLDGVVAGATKAALLLNADMLIEEIGEDENKANDAPTATCVCGGRC